MKAKGFLPEPGQKNLWGGGHKARGCGYLKLWGDLQVVLKYSHFPDLGIFVLLALLFCVGAHSYELSWEKSLLYALIVFTRR